MLGSLKSVQDFYPLLKIFVGTLYNMKTASSCDGFNWMHPEIVATNHNVRY